MDAYETDERFVSELLESTPAARAQLREVVEKMQAHPTPHLLARWSDPKGSGTPEDPYQLGYPIYDPLVYRLTAGLVQANAQPTFDWMAWEGARRYRDADAIASAPLTDVLRVITTIIRGERFCDGTIENAITSGVLLAAATRVTAAIPPVS